MLSTQAVNADQSVVAASASAGTLLAANGRRVGVFIHNNGSTALYVLLDNAATSAGTVSASIFSVKIAADGYWEAPFNFQGAITGIWAGSPTGNAQVTEFTN